MIIPETLYTTKWLGIYRIDTWDFVRRPQSDACVVILAETSDDEIVFIEQFRVPVQCKVIEIPAGLVGDQEEFAGEDLADTARRELLEETGYEASIIEPLIRAPTSPGMTSEFTHIFHARGLTKRHDGGGVDGENITVHLIPKTEVRNWLKLKETEGYVLDFKIHAALWLANL